MTESETARNLHATLNKRQTNKRYALSCTQYSVYHSYDVHVSGRGTGRGGSAKLAFKSASFSLRM